MAIQFKQTAIAIGVALAAFSTVVSADAMIGSGGYSTLKTMEMMKMIDSNGDHMVTNNEFMDYYAAIYEALDTDNDGSIDATEWEGTKGKNKISIATGGYSRQLRSLKTMDAMDSDKDHKVTKAEFIKFHEAIFNTMSKGGTEVDGKGWLAKNTGN